MTTAAHGGNIQAETTAHGGNEGVSPLLRNLRAEMERYGVSVHDIHMLIGKTERCVRDKVNGRATFTLPEAIKIRDTYFQGMSMEYLFASVPENQGGQIGRHKAPPDKKDSA